MFKRASDAAWTERESRQKLLNSRCWFGIQCLDDALKGIFKEDLVLIGAPSGAGKTQLCCNIALKNLSEGKKVHYIALEAGQFEIERRLKYPLIAERYFADRFRPKLDRRLIFDDWMIGLYDKELDAYENEASTFFNKAFRDLFVFYKQSKFGIAELLKEIALCSEETDLIIVDHVHYFDFEDDNENRAIKNLAKIVRQVAIDEGKPIVLISHLRKRDRANSDLVAGLDEFHGSSDLYKIATKVITMAPGGVNAEGEYETFFRMPKNRYGGGVSRYLTKEFFSPKEGCYVPNKYKVGWASLKVGDDFEEISIDQQPEWSRLRGGTGSHDN